MGTHLQRGSPRRGSGAVDAEQQRVSISHRALHLFTKVLPPDFRYPMRDARLSMARLCALQHRFDEASSWFNEAREALDDQGARRLHAIADCARG